MPVWRFVSSDVEMIQKFTDSEIHEGYLDLLFASPPFALLCDALGKMFDGDSFPVGFVVIRKIILALVRNSFQRPRSTVELEGVRPVAAEVVQRGDLNPSDSFQCQLGKLDNSCLDSSDSSFCAHWAGRLEFLTLRASYSWPRHPRASREL
jgi:hypothetical protein